MVELADLMPVATKALELGADIIRNRAPGAVTIKGDRDMATEVDYAVEDALRDFLASETPDIAFMGEEHGGGDAGPGLRWVLDPVDGTANFVRGIPLTGLSLGLAHQGKPVLGVISLPILGLTYAAVTGSGATRDGKPIQASDTTDMHNAIFALGDYAVGDRAAEKNLHRFRLTEALAERVQRVRMFGSAATDLAWVAEGRIDGGIMLANKPWDTCAGVAIARAAGAVVLDRDGTEYTSNATATVAVAPGLVDDTIELLRATGIGANQQRSGASSDARS